MPFLYPQMLPIWPIFWSSCQSQSRYELHARPALTCPTRWHVACAMRNVNQVNGASPVGCGADLFTLIDGSPAHCMLKYLQGRTFIHPFIFICHQLVRWFKNIWKEYRPWDASHLHWIHGGCITKSNCLWLRSMPQLVSRSAAESLHACGCWMARDDQLRLEDRRPLSL